MTNQNTNRQSWEYLTVKVDDVGRYETHERDPRNDAFFLWKPIDELGAEGWELVSVVPEHFENDVENDEWLMGFFKRPRIQDEHRAENFKCWAEMDARTAALITSAPEPAAPEPPDLEARLTSGKPEDRVIARDELAAAIDVLASGNVQPIEGYDFVWMPQQPALDDLPALDHGQDYDELLNDIVEHHTAPEPPRPEPFNAGDRVTTSDGQLGVVLSGGPYDYKVRIDNAGQQWFEAANLTATPEAAPAPSNELLDGFDNPVRLNAAGGPILLDIEIEALRWIAKRPNLSMLHNALFLSLGLICDYPQNEIEILLHYGYITHDPVKGLYRLTDKGRAAALQQTEIERENAPRPAVKLSAAQRRALKVLSDHAHAIIWRKTSDKLLTIHAGTAQSLIRLGYAQLQKMIPDDYVIITAAGRAALEGRS